MSIKTAGLAAGFIVCVAASFGALEAQAQTVARLETTVAVFDEVTTMEDRAIPADLLKKAQCVAIVPGLKKGAFVVGAKFGRGFVSCRTALGWSAPAAIRMEGGSVGFQIGGTEIDVVLAIMNKRGVERLLFEQVHARRRCLGGGGTARPHRGGPDRRGHDRGNPLLVAVPRRVRGRRPRGGDPAGG